MFKDNLIARRDDWIAIHGRLREQHLLCSWRPRACCKIQSLAFQGLRLFAFIQDTREKPQSLELDKGRRDSLRVNSQFESIA